MKRLEWVMVNDFRIESHHGGWLLYINRLANFSRSYPAVVYDYSATAVRGSERHDLGTHDDSETAKRKCAEFINCRTNEASHG